jgi:rubrerythrin
MRAMPSADRDEMPITFSVEGYVAKPSGAELRGFRDEYSGRVICRQCGYPLDEFTPVYGCPNDGAHSG